MFVFVVFWSVQGVTLAVWCCCFTCYTLAVRLLPARCVGGGFGCLLVVFLVVCWFKFVGSVFLFLVFHGVGCVLECVFLCVCCLALQREKATKKNDIFASTTTA